MFTPLNNPILNVKVGRFEPRVMGVSNFRTITPAFGILNRTIGDNEWSLEPSQQGLELNGIFGNGRFAYSAGLVEGRGNKQNDFKDFYGRLEYKSGGMRLDGTMYGEPFTGLISDTWQDNSATIGIFGYHGEADVKVAGGVEEGGFVGIDETHSIITPGNGRMHIFHTPGIGIGNGKDDEDDDVPTEKDRFFKTGADLNWFWDKLNILAGYALQHHNSPIANDPGRSITEHQTFLEFDYALSHWFEPTIRYEVFVQEGGGGTLQRILPQLNFHIGHVVHLFVSEDFVKDEGDGGFSANVGIAGFDIVF